MSKLKVGIAGYGIVGKRRRVCVDSNSNMELVAVCDRTFDDHGTFSDGVNFYMICVLPLTMIQSNHG